MVLESALEISSTELMESRVEITFFRVDVCIW